MDELKKKPWKRILSLIYRLHQPTGDFLYGIKYFLERGWYGWSEQDVWDVAYTLDTLVPELLEHLKKTKHGVPCSMLANKWEHSEEELEAGYKKFKAILDEIILGFKEHKKLTEEASYKVDPETTKAVLKRSFELMLEHYDSLCD